MLDKKTVTEVAMIVNYQISKTGSACQHITREEAMLMEPIRISPAGGDFILALQKGHWTILVDLLYKKIRRKTILFLKIVDKRKTK